MKEPRRVNLCYDNNKLYMAIIYWNNIKILPKQSNDYIKKTPYIVDGDKVKYSIPKEEYKQQTTHGYTNEEVDYFVEDDHKFPEKYYWKTPDGWLYLYDKDKPEVISLYVVVHINLNNVIQPQNI